jgi:hypothetical protein
MSTLRWIAICVGAVSLFSLLERLTNLVLAPHVNNFLGLYRSILYPFCAKIIDYSQMALATYHIRVPILPLDFVILYTLVSLAVAHFMINQRKQIGSVPVVILLLPFALIWPVIMIGNIVALCISPKLGFSNILFGWDMELAKVIATCLAIFGANFYLLA